MSLDVTVAICTWNRKALLESTLESLCQLSVPMGANWEVLIVDNGSSDGTGELVARWIEKQVLPLRYVWETTLGLSNARNRAIRERRSDWILFTDDDVILDKDWLRGFLESRGRHPAAGAIGGRVDPWFVEQPDAILSEAFPVLARGFCGIDLGPEERFLPNGTDLVGANFSIRVDPALNILFNPLLGPVGKNPIGGDELGYLMELRKAGLNIVWCPAMRVKHYVDPKRMTLAYLQQFYTNVGRHEVTLHGIPPGTRLGGAPRWLYGVYAKHLVNGFVSTIGRKRIEALKARRQQWLIGGMIAECRAMGRQQSAS
jgi:glycosyltransferase involved in cell wall biosynthesis